MTGTTKGLLIAIAALAACDMPRPTNARVDAPAHASAAIEVVEEWLAARLDRTDVRIKPDAIIWTEGPTLDIPGIPGDWHGYAYDVWPYGCEAWVVRKATITASAFVHEMVHCFMLDETGDLDLNHDSDLFSHDVLFEGESVLWDWECPRLYPDDIDRLCKPLEYWQR